MCYTIYNEREVIKMFFNFKRAKKNTAVRIDVITEITKILGDSNHSPSIRIIFNDNSVSNVYYTNEDMLNQDFQDFISKNT